MPSVTQLDRVYMKMAEEISLLSHARRNKVGAVLVTPKGTAIPSWNGLPSKLGNVLEDTVANELVTKPEVTHAELGCILKSAKEGVSTEGCTIYVTLSPCDRCASMLAAAGVQRVVYKERYRDPKGLDILDRCGIIVEQFE